MANYKATTEEFQQVANKIRDITGTTTTLEWPNGYVTELEKIENNPLASLGEVDPILNNNSWEKISQVAQIGAGEVFWDIGDCKEIILNGNIGDALTLNNYHTYIFILDFNLSINKTIPDKNIIFGGFKTALSDGIDIALCDNKYGSGQPNEKKYFKIQHYNTYNYGGWAGCDLRYDILGATSTQPLNYGTARTPSNIGYDAVPNTITAPVANTLMAALSNDFRKNLRLWTRWTNNKGSVSGTQPATGMLAIVDGGISMLTSAEVFPVNSTYSNANLIAEAQHCKQLAYYVNGNSYSKFKHDNSTTKAAYFLASPSNTTSTAFWQVREVTTAMPLFSTRFLSDVSGLAPIFKV